ncbi:CoA transferase [Paludibacterium paludis]|uniref:CoA transferase n=1 Tax=Paludibacterium paludis TaxID=1225769 RepID=A0A918P5I4_9NEIS|nr:CoA transferase [Paludibacterium paludis]GGY23370.1 CoA transferase [Paludibacterium paludis]
MAPDEKLSGLTRSALATLWRSTGLDERALDHVNLTGDGQSLPSSFAVGCAAQASIAASALAAAHLWQLRGGAWQTVSVDRRAAEAEFRSERYLRVDGSAPPDPWDALAGLYRCGDGRWVRLHTNFPHHRQGLLDLLGCGGDREDVAAALRGWRAAAVEDALAERGLVGSMVRSFDEWDAHPQARALADLPVFTLERIGDAPAEPLPPALRPLSGVRVLDLTRIIAGPVGTRALAAHGAEVLLVTSPRLPSIPSLVIDTGRGKRSCQLDLTQAEDRGRLAHLLRQADVLVDGYRPGGLAGLGFGAEAAAALRPGMVCVSLSAYSHAGPWAGRRGFDSLVQAATGFNLAEAEAAGRNEPLALPAQALDHAAGYLIALGAIAALSRRATEGGSWHVRVSLAQTARWLRGLGRIDNGFAVADPDRESVRDCLEESGSGFGRLSAVGHAAVMATTPAGWERPSVPLGRDEPVWPEGGGRDGMAAGQTHKR